MRAVDDCKHSDGTFLCSKTDSLWGPGFGQFCKLCGFCVSDPESTAKPEAARIYREFAAAVAAFEKRSTTMTPEEKEQWEQGFVRGVDGRLRGDKLAKQLEPFRSGLTYWG